MEATNLILRIAALDPTFSGTPQEFVDHFVERAEILSPAGFYNVVVADIAPTHNEGLLLLGGTKIYVWDAGQAKYIPAVIDDSLYHNFDDVKKGGKWVLVSDGGYWGWKKAADFLSWLGSGLGNIPLGPSGTILSSLASVDWRTPANALPDATVPVGKLQATPAEVTKVAMVAADGKVSWQSLSTLGASVKSTVPLIPTDPKTLPAVPARGTSYAHLRPGGTHLLRMVLVKVAADPGTVKYPVGDEVDVNFFMEAIPDGGRAMAFSIADTVAAWTLNRMPNSGAVDNIGSLELVGRDDLNIGITHAVVTVDPNQWRVKAYWF